MSEKNTGPEKRCRNCSNWLAPEEIDDAIDVEKIKTLTGTDLSVFAAKGIGLCTISPLWLPCAPEHWCKRFWSS
jgi:hypothetical protein